MADSVHLSAPHATLSATEHTEEPVRHPPEPGLCGRCRHARVVQTRTGSRFVLCELSRTDTRFPRYPPLPVLACAGFEPVADGPSDRVSPHD